MRSILSLRISICRVTNEAAIINSKKEDGNISANLISREEF
jgi:hypothetical protein